MGLTDGPEHVSLAVDRHDADGRLRVVIAVRDARRIRQVERIDLRHQHSAVAALLGRVGNESSPDVELLDIDAVQRAQVTMRELEERELVALEVEPERERETGEWLEPNRLGSRPNALARCRFRYSDAGGLPRVRSF